MASTIKLQRTASFVSQHVKNIPLMFDTNTSGDPLLTIADWVRQFILAPPFAWRWNRSTVTGNLKQGAQDLTLSVPDFGWLEKGIYIDSTGATYELESVEALGVEAQQNQPRSIAVLDDDGDNVTFRIFPPPAEDCTISIIYQKAASTFQSDADTWAPIPDWLSYLYTQGTMAKVYEYADDSRALAAMQIFVKQVLAANEGLSDAQKALFLPELVLLQKTAQSAMQKSQLGNAGRGLFQ